MLEPLQNILFCADVIVNQARPQLKNSKDIETLWLAQIGELDHAAEIQKVAQELKKK